MQQVFYDMMENSPIIAAVKDDEGLKNACRLEDVKVIFVLYGDICRIGQIVKFIKEHDKFAVIHMDLIAGFSSKEVSVDFIKNNVCADGIITTKPNLIRRGKELNLMTIFRFFALDSLSLQNIVNMDKHYPGIRPDFVEILPGIMPRIITQVKKSSRIPVIASGLIVDKEDVMNALSAGAISISSTNQNVWKM